MNRFKVRNILIFIALAISFLFSCVSEKSPIINVIEIPGQNKIEIKVDGKDFTSYIWPDKLKKPVLYPIHTSDGTIITRGFPLEPRPGESVDHPHHVGSWMNYGDVNGLDFWNNSYAIPDSSKYKYGSIRHEKILNTESGPGIGILEVEATWRNSKGEILLIEKTRFEFTGGKDYRSIERFTTLTATDNTVAFTDNKEGFFAIRMDRAFEFPSDEPEVITDSKGNMIEVKVMDNEGVNGHYLSSEGVTGEEVWGTRAKWMSLSAEKDGEKISVVIMDHPQNRGFPTYWHARTYGLFSANPLGQAIFSKGEQELNLNLEPGESVEFKFKIYIKSGDYAKANELDKLQAEFSKKQQ